MEDHTICRVCLSDADIPIYGEEDEHSIAEDIKTFGDIQLRRDDAYPKHICVTCYQLLQSAVVFRNTAQETELLMTDSLTDEGITFDNPNSAVSCYYSIKSKGTKTSESYQSELSHNMDSTCSDEKNILNDNEMIMIIVSDTQIKCQFCEKTITKSCYKLHLKSHGIDNEKEETLKKCPYCKKSVCYSYYKAHIERIHQDRVIDKTVYETLRKEDQTNKSINEIRQVICDKCGKIFKRKHSLKLHMLTHGTEYTYKCMFCPYRGRHASLLKIHVRTHTGDYNYKCSKCPAQFTTKSNLNKHLQRHIGPVDFKCELCEKCFYSKPDLNKHYGAIHLGLKNYVCNICGKAFSFRNNMMCHQLKVHKRKRLTDGKGRVADYLKDKLDSEIINE